MKKAKKSVEVELEEFTRWLVDLTPLDELNFRALINLPNAAKLIAKLDDGEYKRMAIFGLALMKSESVI